MPEESFVPARNFLVAGSAASQRVSSHVRFWLPETTSSQPLVIGQPVLPFSFRNSGSWKMLSGLPTVALSHFLVTLAVQLAPIPYDSVTSFATRRGVSLRSVIGRPVSALSIL